MITSGYRLVAERVLSPHGWLTPGAVLIDGGLIRDVGEPAAVGDAAPSVVLGDCSLVPGFVDLQVCGFAGVDFANAEAPDYNEIGPKLAASGVTAYCPAVVSMPWNRYPQILTSLANAMAHRAPGHPRILGAHLEGPALSRHRPGVHDPEWFVAPGRVIELVDRVPEVVRLVTLAPELADAQSTIRELRERGVHVALGHTEATFEETNAAAAAGAGLVTHLFNAMTPLHHRAPGTVGAALTNPRLRASVIADGDHVHPAVFQLAFAALGDGRLVLTTDATAATQMPPGHYPLGTATIETNVTGAPRDHDGVLSGSVLTMDEAVRNAVRWGASTAEAIRMASTTPAATLDLAGTGQIAPGALADLVVLDAGLSVLATICGGVVAFDRDVRFARLPDVSGPRGS